MPLLVVTFSFFLLFFFLQIFCVCVPRWRVFFSRHQALFSFLFWAISIGLILFFYAYVAYSQYVVWKNSDSPFRFLVPPHGSVFYVLGYYFFRYLLYYCVSFIVSIFLFFGMRFANKRFGGRFFEDEEILIAPILVFFLGYPSFRYAWLFFLGILLSLYFVLHLFFLFYKRVNGTRIPLYFLWAPSAVLALLGMFFLFPGRVLF